VNKEILHSRWRLPPASKEDDRFPTVFLREAQRTRGLVCGSQEIDVDVFLIVLSPGGGLNKKKQVDFFGSSDYSPLGLSFPFAAPRLIILLFSNLHLLNLLPPLHLPSNPQVSVFEYGPALNVLFYSLPLPAQITILFPKSRWVFIFIIFRFRFPSVSARRR
jgi:hypothetical protein